MVATASLAGELRGRGFRSLLLWPRGVDARLFHPGGGRDLGVPRPVFLAVGRLAVEKNVEAFLSLDPPGSKIVVGDGPAWAMLANRFPDALFLGTRRGADLAAIYAGADAFVFPSLPRAPTATRIQPSRSGGARKPPDSCARAGADHGYRCPSVVASKRRSRHRGAS
jgi:hypothetical protein